MNRNAAPSTLQEIETAIAEAAADLHAEEAYLFGSLARGSATRKSDVDIVFVQESALRFIERADPFLRILWTRLHGRGIDVLVYTPQEFRRMRDSGNRFIQRVLSEGRKIYGN